MNQVMESVLTVCVALVAAELLRRFCPEDQMVRFVSGLVALGLLLSLVGAVTGLELDLPLSAAQGQRQQEELSSYLEELSSYLEEQYQQAAQQDGEAYVQSLLAAAGLQAKEIQVSTDRNQDGSIVLTEVAAVFTYPVEGERASALLRNALGEGVRVMVETGG